MRVDGVPTSITRDQVNALCVGLGLDPTVVVELHLTPCEVTAVVFARNEQGKRYAIGNEAAKHRLSIEIKGAC